MQYMEQLIPKCHLKEMKNYDKILTRLTSVTQIYQTLWKYIRNSHKGYQSVTHGIQNMLSDFNQELANPSLLSSKTANVARLFSGSISKLLQTISYVILKSGDDLKQNLSGQTGIQLERIEKCITEFKTRFTKYCQEVEKIEQNELKVYTKAADRLGDLLKATENSLDPIIFYNTQNSKQLPIKLQRKHRTALERQGQLKLRIGQLRQLKRQVQAAMKEVKNIVADFINTRVRSAMNLIFKFVRNAVGQPQINKVSHQKEKNERESEKQQIHKTKKGLIKEEEASIEEGLKVFDTDRSEFGDTEILQLKEWNAYCKEKAEICKREIKLQKVFLSLLKDFVQSTNELQANFVKASTAVFGANKIDKFKKDLKLHLGENVSQLFEQLQNLIQKPSVILGQINRAVSLRINSLKLSVQEQQVRFSKFQQDFTTLYKSHKKAEKKSKTVTDSHELKQELLSNYNQVRKIVEVYKKEEFSAEHTFKQSLIKLTESIEKATLDLQLASSSLKDDGVTFIVDSGVSKVMEDRKYSIIFDPFFSGEIQIGYHFGIDSQAYRKRHDILLKREELFGQFKPSKSSLIGCFDAKLQRKAAAVYRCNLLNGVELTEGELEFFQGALRFKGEGGLFSAGMEIIIPKQEIKGCSQKQVAYVHLNGIVVKTAMGNIDFEGFECASTLVDKINKAYGIQQKLKSQSLRTTPQRITGIMSNRSLERQQVSLQRVVPSKQKSLRDFVKHWAQDFHCFGNQFKVIKQKKSQERITSLYQALLGDIVVKVKEQKTVKSIERPPSMEFKYRWKVKCVDGPSIGSFQYKLAMHVQLRGKILTVKNLPIDQSIGGFLKMQFGRLVLSAVSAFRTFVSQYFDQNFEIQFGCQRNLQVEPEQFQLPQPQPETYVKRRHSKICLAMLGFVIAAGWAVIW